MIRILLAVLSFLGVIPAAAGSGFAPLVLYAGTIDDGSFNESVHRGVLRFERESGVDVVEQSISYQAHRFPVALQDAINTAANPLVTFPSTQSEFDTLVQFAELHAHRSFAVIDAEIHLPNVQSILFKEQEATFLAGILAGMASRSGVVGFVGGIGNAVIRDRFAWGFQQGLHEVDPAITLLEAYVGRTPNSWFKPERGYRIARSQIEQGADVIFHAAGESGLGVLRAAAEAGQLGIGADLNQNPLHPGHVLTSVIKRVDQAVYLVLYEAWRGEPVAGVRYLGLAEDAVGLAMDGHNAPLITPAMGARIETLASRIRGGHLVIGSRPAVPGAAP